MAQVPSAEVLELARTRSLGSHVRSGYLHGMEDGEMWALTVAATALGLGMMFTTVLLMPLLIPAALLLAIAPEPIRRWRLRQPRARLHCFEGGVVFAGDQRDQHIEVLRLAGAASGRREDLLRLRLRAGV